MAQTQVSYTDKVENSGATNDGKVLAVDMNELKSVVNDNATDAENSLFNRYLDGYQKNGLHRAPVGTNDIDAIRQNSTYLIQNSTQTGTHPPFSEGSGKYYFLTHYQFSNSDNAIQMAYSMNAGDGEIYYRRLSSIWGAWQEIALADDFVPNDTTEVKIGLNAGSTSQGANSVAIGNQAGITNQSANSVCLGELSAVTGTLQIQLGKSGTTTYAYGAVQDRSDERDKADIQDIHLGLDFIDALTPKSYKFDYREDYRDHRTEMQDVVIGQDEDGNGIIEQQEVTIPDTRELGEITHDGTHKRSRLHCGLVAQEVKQVMDDLGVDFGGYQDHSINGGQDVMSIGYGELIAPMIKAIQELKARVEVLEGS